MTIIQSPSHSPSFNLAAEEFFFSQCKEDILFLYVNSPSVIMGCNQLLEAEVDKNYCQRKSIPVYKRMSGGGTVYHDFGNINYAFITNKAEGSFPLDGAFLKPIITAIAELGVPLEIGKRKDLWMEGFYKVSGTASHVSKSRELHHGTLLYSADIQALEKALTPSTDLIPHKKHIQSVRSKIKNIQQFMLEKNLNPPAVSIFFQWFTEKLTTYFQVEMKNQLLYENIDSLKALEAKYKAHF